MDRLLGLDYGRRRIGISISDPLGITAQPLATWIVENRTVLEQRLRHLVEEYNIRCIVLGLPLTLKGERGRMAREIDEFAARIRNALNVRVILWDERLTSVQAKRSMHAGNLRTGHHKESVDRIAAVLLLQSYLDYLRESGEIKETPI